MNEKMPWLFLKRLNSWNPLGDAKAMMAAPLPASGPAPKERKAWKLRARWSLEA
ncbi:MAG: hypothetical protein HY077_16180 [Elusimicrobia bacterium]|nr:hypothetical protein [Elusimicrobiota bacterium]